VLPVALAQAIYLSVQVTGHWLLPSNPQDVAYFSCSPVWLHLTLFAADMRLGTGSMARNRPKLSCWNNSLQYQVWIRCMFIAAKWLFALGQW
jgi:hypothetical protein